MIGRSNCLKAVNHCSVSLPRSAFDMRLKVQTSDGDVIEIEQDILSQMVTLQSIVDGELTLVSLLTYAVCAYILKTWS